MNTPGAGFNFGGGGGGGISATDPTTPVATASVPAIRIDQEADVGTILMKFRGAAYNDATGLDPNEPTLKDWNVVLSEPNTGFVGIGERPDRLFVQGYNISIYGGGTPTPQEDPTDCSFGITWEDYYNFGGASSTIRQVELYPQVCPAGDNGTNQKRPWMVIMQFPTLESDTPPECGMSFNIETSQGFTITATYQNEGTLSTRTSDTAGTVTVTAGHNIVTATTKNVRWLVGGVYGRRTGVTIGSVSGQGAGSTVAFSGGSGDILPAQGSAIEFFDTDVINIQNGTTNNGQDTVMSFTLGAGLLADNNSRWLKQKNATGTPRDLLYADSSNFLQISDGGWPTVRVNGYLETYGVKTHYVSAAGRTNGADTDVTGNGWGSSTPANGTILAIRNSTDGLTYLSCRFNGAWRAVQLT